jgi:hypothetical protein
MKSLFKAGSAAMVVGSLSLAGCMSTTAVEDADDIIINSNYIVNIPDAEFIPSKEQLQSTEVLVVVLPVKSSQTSGFEVGAVPQLTASIEDGLNQAGIEIIDRSLAGSLADELYAYEASGEYNGSGINVADYAIMPAVGNVEIRKSHSAARTWKKDGKMYSSPATCTFRATMTGSIKLYQMPEMSNIDSLSLNGTSSQSYDSNNSSCPMSNDLIYAIGSAATEDAVYAQTANLQSHFSKAGYVLEYRKKDDFHMVNISLGSNNKIKPGQKIKFSTKTQRTNRVTGKTSISEIPYSFSGIVSDLIEADNSWVIIEEEAETKVKFGDLARTHYEKSFMDGVMKKSGLSNFTK